MSLVTRKPVFRVFDWGRRLKPGCSATEASNRHEMAKLEILYIYIYYLGSEQQRHWSDCRSAPLLFAHGINRFFHDVAHLSLTFLFAFFKYSPVAICWEIAVSLGFPLWFFILLASLVCVLFQSDVTLWKVTQAIYIVYTNCMPDFMILAQAVLQIFCSQVHLNWSYGWLCKTVFPK